MKAMMCEANRKEDRMCGKQMERRQPSGEGHNAQPLRPAQWLCLKWPETPGLSAERGALSSSLPGATSAAETCMGRLGAWEGFGSWLLPAVIPHCPKSAFFVSFLVQNLSAAGQPRGLGGSGPWTVSSSQEGWADGCDTWPLYYYGSTFLRLPVCFDKFYNSHFILLILPACQMLQLHRKS